MERGRLASLALKTLLLLFAAFAVGAASPQHQHEDVPVFVIGADGGLSPRVLWREEFREFVFPRLAEALALKGFRAIGEAPFRARYPVDGVAGERLSRWDSHDFLYYASRVAADEAGNTAPYFVAVNIWGGMCRDDETHICLDIGAEIYETTSRERFAPGGLGDDIRIPEPADCGEYCILNVMRARSEELFHPFGIKIASRLAERLSARTGPARE